MTGYGVQVVQRILPDQWRILRKLRLAGLAEVLGTDHEGYLAEQRYDEFSWRAMIAADPQFIASARSIPVGLACLSLEPEHGQEAAVSFLWVQPSHRGMGVTTALMGAVADWVDRGGYRSGMPPRGA